MTCDRTFVLAIFVSCLALTTPSRADTPGFDKVLSAVTLDFAGNGQIGRAVLAEGDDATADLYLYLVKDDSSPESGLSLVQEKANVVFSGRMWGQLASLAVNNAGSLQVKSGNDAIGRDRWSLTLTIVYREQEFVIAGVTFATHDTLNPQAGGDCDINLLTGKGLRNGKPVEARFTPIRLGDWSDEKLPQACKF
jgi:hypothetical protein